VTASGLLLPLAAGLAATLMLNTDSLSGAHGTPTTVALVFALAIAVTSVPVISRILVDLGIINSPLARRIITVAVLEDVCLYGVLAVVLALAEARSGQSYGVWAALGVTSTGMSIACYVGTSIVVFATLLRWGPRAIHALGQSRLNPLRRHSPLAFRLALWLALPLGCVMVGINPIFGGLLAGICVARADALSGAEEDRRASKSLARFSLAFFVPVYFAIVGLSLDLPNQFDLAFFVPFLAFGCVVKATSVWLGARLAGESQRSATSLAVALNARGGPGIVLASVTLNAGIINARFFTSLVMLSIVTSQVAGAWLGWSLRSSKGREAVGAELSPAAAGLRS
jgi:Kef-type K+ transport system membrane component KefB